MKETHLGKNCLNEVGQKEIGPGILIEEQQPGPRKEKLILIGTGSWA